MKHQALFSSKDKSKKLKCRLQQFLFVALKALAAAVNSTFKSQLLLIDGSHTPIVI